MSGKKYLIITANVIPFKFFANDSESIEKLSCEVLIAGYDV